MNNNDRLGMKFFTIYLVLLYVIVDGLTLSWSYYLYTLGIGKYSSFFTNVLSLLPWFALVGLTCMSGFFKRKYIYLKPINTLMIIICCIYLYGYLSMFFQLPGMYFSISDYFLYSSHIKSSSFVSFILNRICILGIIGIILSSKNGTQWSLAKQLGITIVIFIAYIVSFEIFYIGLQYFVFHEALSISWQQYLLYRLTPNDLWIMLCSILLIVVFLSSIQASKMSQQPMNAKHEFKQLSNKRAIILFVCFLIGVPFIIVGLLYIYAYVFNHHFVYNSYSAKYVIQAILDVLGSYRWSLLIFFTFNAIFITLLWRFFQYRMLVVIYTIFACNMYFFVVIDIFQRLMSEKDSFSFLVSLREMPFLLALFFFGFFLAGYFLMITIGYWFEKLNVTHHDEVVELQ